MFRYVRVRKRLVKMLVLLKPVPDARVPLGFNEAAGKLKPDWNLTMLNPADASSVEAALRIKEHVPGTQITLVYLGPPSGEHLVREVLALGCDEAVRIWDEGLDQLTVEGKAMVLSRAAEVLTYDLILAGARSVDTVSAQLGILLAFHLGIPCISRVTAFDLLEEKVIATRRLDRGFSERMEAPFPLVITVEAQAELTRYASLPDLIEASERNITCLDLAEMGITRESVRQTCSRLHFGPLRAPVSRQRFIAAPDSALPVFERIQKLLQGTMTTREGKVISGEEDHVAEEIFQTLLREGWLNHLGKGSTCIK